MRFVIVTHFFPPDTTPGAVRPHALATGLSELGHEVTVLTAARDAERGPYEVSVVPYTRLGGHVKRALALDESANLAAEAEARGGRWRTKIVRTAAHMVEATLQRPDKYRAWRKALRRWHAGEGAELPAPDVVIASVPPFSAAFAGADLAAGWRSPFVLDLRDLWTENPYYPHGRLRRMLDRRAEETLLRGADAVVSVTESRRDILQAAYPGLEVEVIHSGVLRPPPSSPSPRLPGQALRVVHLGSMEDHLRRDPTPIIAAASRLIASGQLPPASVVFEFVGPVGAAFGSLTLEEDIARFVRVSGHVAREEASERLRDSDAALLLMWEGDRQSLPMKAIEYMANRKTVLVCGAHPDAEVRRLLSGYEGVHFCDDEPSSERALIECWQRRSAGEPLDRPDPARARPFLAPSMAARFAALGEELRRKQEAG